SPQERVDAGKPAEGTLWLRAFHEGGQVNVEIRDDGGGINLERVKQKALSNAMATPEQLAAMNDRELTNLILLPGFSTAQKVTNVSGRGVGMDVVKTNVEKIGGTLEIQSVFGRGTTLRIKIPLTLAIVPALVVTCEGDRYAIPQVSLLELVRLDGGRARREIELVHNVPAYRLRGRLLPLLYLDEELGLRAKRTAREHGEEESVNIVVLQAEDRQFGLVVNQINDTQEIVVKPLSQQLKGISTYAGATIMGDGSVSLILDVNGLAAHGHVLTEQHDYSQHADGSLSGDTHFKQTTWLLVDPGDGSHAAIRLASVERLEEFSGEQVEMAAGRQVVQYRGQIMPLIALNGGGYYPEGEGDVLQVVVYAKDDQCVGIIVGRILDVVDESNMLDDCAHRGSKTRVISGRVTTLINLEDVVLNSMHILSDIFTVSCA
ncbi:MAG: chemotaxis protein CheW, partial [Planctomycetales bacterium]|nr:chemotaxis protein CheW [Planctomycetales bacterium]